MRTRNLYLLRRNNLLLRARHFALSKTKGTWLALPTELYSQLADPVPAGGGTVPFIHSKCLPHNSSIPGSPSSCSASCWLPLRFQSLSRGPVFSRSSSRPFGLLALRRARPANLLVPRNSRIQGGTPSLSGSSFASVSVICGSFRAFRAILFYCASHLTSPNPGSRDWSCSRKDSLS